MTTKEHKWFGELRVGELLSIDNDRITLRLEEKSGQRARLRLEFKAPTTVQKIEPAMARFAAQGVR